MKKTLLYALSLSALVLGVTSCKNGKEPEKPKEDTTTVHSAMKTLAEASELRIETAGTYSSLREITYNSAVEFTKDASFNFLVISLYFLYSIILLISSSSVISSSSFSTFGNKCFDFKYNNVDDITKNSLVISKFIFSI